MADVTARLGMLLIAGTWALPLAAQDAEDIPESKWSFEEAEDGCSLTVRNADDSGSFGYTKLFSGGYRVSVKSDKLQEKPTPSSPMLVHIGKDNYTIGADEDAFVFVERDEESKNFHLRQRLLDDDRPEYFGITIGDSEQAIFSLAHVDTVSAQFTLCVTNMLREGLNAPRLKNLPPKLIDFDGIDELSTVAGRLGMLTQDLAFMLEVDETGKVTGCKLAREYRRKIVNAQICDVLKEHFQLEPARDQSGEPVASTYEGQISFRGFVSPD